MNTTIGQNNDPNGHIFLLEPGDAARQWETVAKGDDNLWGKDGFGFDDFLDLINPLQHIPIISTIYRAITGDKLEPGARLIGGILFGGPIGFVAAMVNTIMEQETGGDLGENIIAMATGKSLTAPATDNTKVATAVTAATSTKYAAATAAATTTTVANSTATSKQSVITVLPNVAPGKAMFLPKNSAANLAYFQNQAAAKTNAATAGQDQKRAAMRAATGQTQRLSPRAFDAMMKSIGAVKLQPNAAVPGSTAQGSAAQGSAAQGSVGNSAAKNAVAGGQTSQTGANQPGTAQLPEILRRRRFGSSQQLVGAGARQLPILKNDAALELHRLLKRHALKLP